MTELTLDQLIEQIRKLRADGAISTKLSRAETISFAWGNAHISNPNVTREMVEEAYDKMRAEEDKVVGELFSPPESHDCCDDHE